MRPKLPRHHRFYFPPQAVTKGAAVAFPADESRHMLASLRVSRGDVVSATDGQGRVCEVVVEHAGYRKVIGRITRVEQEVREGPEVAVFQGIIKPAKMELVVEKCTELGICDFIPVITQRSLKGLSLTRIERLKRIAVEAMKQSLGAFLPGVRSPQRFNDALALLPGFGSALVAWEGEEQVNLRGILKKSRRGPVAIWIGPEGGFTPEEIGHLTSRGAATFGLGNLRLKAETAAIAAVAILRHLT